MDEMQGISAAIVGALVIALRVIERTHDKKHKNGNSDTRIALLEQQIQDLQTKVEDWGSKTVETLRLVYELREQHKIAQARREAADEARRELGA
tara:strand:+ start:471 stop:752 length:282 start_codon:yes stop_codon:yes gene_type:complete